MFINEHERAMYENFTNYRVMKTLWSTMPPILLLLGTFGNVMVMVVLNHQSRSVSTYVYLIALAIADEIVLVNSLTKRWLEHFFGIPLDCLHAYTCKLFHFIGSSSSHLAVWLIIAVTIERVLVVSFPFRAHRYTSVSLARLVVICLSATSFVINFHYFFTVQIGTYSDVVQGNNWTLNISVNYCDIRNDLQDNFREIWSWLDAIIYSYIPFAIIIVSNSVIIYKLRKAQDLRRVMTQEVTLTKSTSTSSGAGRPEKYAPPWSTNPRPNRGMQRTVMLLTVSFMFLFTALPVAVLKIIIAILHTSTRILIVPSYNASYILASTVAEILMLLNHTANFFLYCAAGQKFRRDFQLLVNCQNSGLSKDASRTSRQSSKSPRSETITARSQLRHAALKRSVTNGTLGGTPTSVDSPRNMSKKCDRPYPADERTMTVNKESAV